MQPELTIIEGGNALTDSYPTPLQEQKLITVPRPAREGTNLQNLPSVWTLVAEVTWLIEGMIPEHGITLLCAPSGTGKTWLAHAIGGAVAHGTPFLGCAVERRLVVYLDRENPLAIVKRNLAELGIKETSDFKIWGGWNAIGPPAPNDTNLVQFAKVHQPLIILDSLVRFHPGDEQSAKDTSAFMKQLRDLADLGVTVVALHHTGKSKTSQKYRGSSDFEAAVDMAYSLEGKPQKGRIDRLTMKPFKSRFAPGQDFSMEFVPGVGFELDDVVRWQPSPEDTVRGIILVNPGLNGSEIVAKAKTQGLSKHATEEVLKGLPFTPGKGKARHYSLPPAEEKEAE